ncbi:thiol peroxidase [Campylobacter sp.]|uniref:thiol peroxidase n=1 Tax=Campylobacter sp. TaxID=205 RepID=UPI0026DCB115|nr:thiol peroxidase [Campylobacter sp.]MDO4674060.1 thiol peroxidase [Campylobacter sp.]
MSVTFKGNAVRLKGNSVALGEVAPKLSLKAKDLSAVEIAKEGRVQIVLTVPSLDTPVCASEAREFNQKIASYNGAEVVVVSMDLPFAMGRFCSTENIDNITVASDFVSKEFGEKYGVLIADGALEGLLARAVFVIKDGKIAYKELVSEITQMPDIAKLDAFFAEKSSCCGGCGCH